ncbi:MAG: decarboxylating 6-phosphogluconate dehydrogenase [Bacteriovoracaceae bacterium]|nr:decarboxylating 6-phosphogluconate dehydrogenase [Bacteriovoracaceae bacterium]
MKPLEIGFIGLGRMGQNMVSKMLSSKTVRVVVWNRDQQKVQKMVEQGAVGAQDIQELLGLLKQSRKIVWLMLPAGEVTEAMFNKVLPLLKSDDIIIDGANSNYKDSKRRHRLAKERGVDMLDVGVSGGIIAAQTGYPMMVGGKQEVFDYLAPIFNSFGITEGVDLVGGQGAGHYVKMIHNAIEYGMMQAIAEGFDLLKNGSMENLDLKKISHLWNHGTIVSSFLMQMTESALKKDVSLEQIKAFVADSGEGKWSVEEAIANDVPFIANTYALQARFQSRDPNSFTFKLLAALRNEFGGHAVSKED